MPRTRSQDGTLRMKTLTWGKSAVLASIALVLAAPALAQSTDGAAETRLRALEAEVRALQRTVFPGGDGKYFPPQVQPGQAGTPVAGTPAATPLSDVLVRMDAVEAQLARLTAQGEENANRITKLEAQLGAAKAADGSAAATAAPASTATGATTNSNLSAMTSGASAPKPAASVPAATAKPTSPTAQRLAAVKAVQKPATADAGDDEYSYGFRLWEAKFYPEAQQQLKLFLQKYPKHARVSYARNLLGRAYLDEGNPREAASWFLQNYQAKAPRDRAPDSLLMLAESMRQLKDTNRACVALTQFGQEFPGEAAGRLKGQYDSTRGGLKCPAG